MQEQGKFASALVSGEGFGAAAGGEDDEAKTAYSVGMLRALKEANRGLVSDSVLENPGTIASSELYQNDRFEDFVENGTLSFGYELNENAYFQYPYLSS